MYSNAKYITNGFSSEVVGIAVDIGGVRSTVPIDPANTDYANIMKLVEAGELTIAPADTE